MKLIKSVLSFLSHFLFIGVIVYFFWPIAQYYYQSNPPLGADFLQFPTFVSYIRDHFQLLLPMSWRYSWFSGNPLIIDYAWLHFYLTLPLTAFFSAVKASLVYIDLATAAYFIFSYLLFYQFSRSRFVSMVLSISLVTSVSSYKTLFDGGVATSAASKMFLPLTLLFVVKYFKKKNIRYLLLAGMVAGLASLAHVGIYLVLILPLAMILLVFWKDENTKLIDFSKIKPLFVLVVTSMLVGAATFYPMIQMIFERSGAGGLGVTTKAYEDAFVGIYTFTNPLLFALFALFAVLVVLFRKFKKIPQAISVFALIGYLLLTWFLLLVGHHPLGQAMGPDRLYFAFTLFLAAGVAIFWHAVFPCPEEGWRSKKMLLPLLSLVVFIPIFVSSNMPALPYFGDGFQTKLINISSKNGYPSNVFAAVSYDKKEEANKIMNPPWLDANDTNYRYFMLEGGIETWWNTIFPLPQVRGYANPLKSKANDWLYWLDNALLGEFVWHFHVPEIIAKQHALFLIDWYAMRYLQSEILVFPDYILKDPAIIETTTVNNNTSEPLHIFKLKDSATSPIIRATNSSSVLLVGNVVAYDTFLKLLATGNLNSRAIVPIHGPEFIEDLSSWNLADFDAIFLYNYGYHNEKDFRKRPSETWNKLEEYVKNGGKLIIENGAVDVDSVVLSDRKLDILPAVFPIEKTAKLEVGTQWNLTPSGDAITKDVDFAKFSPLLYENVPWKISVAQGTIKPWAKVVLSQQGKPVLVAGDLGKGKVVWSGMNLPYHFVYYLNLSEDKLFQNILGSMVNLIREEDIKTAKIERPTPEKIKVSGSGFSGVIFKETFDDGWQGSLLSPQNQSLKVYKAGLYYMYIRIPSHQDQAVATLTFRGSLTNWIIFIISFGTIILILIKCVIKIPHFNLKFISNWEPLKKKLTFWWGKEEEEE